MANGSDKCFSSFYNKLNKLINKHAPFKILSKRKAKEFSKLWITKGLLKSIKIKNRLFYSGDILKCKLYRNRIVSLYVCCYGDIMTTITMCSSYSTSTLLIFNPVDLVFAHIFLVLLFYIILCPHCDIISHRICINQNLEQLGATKNAITILHS